MRNDNLYTRICKVTEVVRNVKCWRMMKYFITLLPALI